MAMKPQAYAIFNYLKEHDGEKIIAPDIAAALNIEKVASVNGTLTSFQKKDLIVRIPGEILDPSTGLHKTVKFIELTDAGKEFEPKLEDDEKE